MRYPKHYPIDPDIPNAREAVRVLDAFAVTGTDTIPTVPFSWLWSGADALATLKLCDLFQRQSRKRGPFYWIARLTDAGRKLIDEMRKHEHERHSGAIHSRLIPAR